MEEGRDRGPQEIDAERERRDVERRYEPRADLISRLAAVIASLASTFDGVQRVHSSFVSLIRRSKSRETRTVATFPRC